jgi:hypothetical protein
VGPKRVELLENYDYAFETPLGARTEILLFFLQCEWLCMLPSLFSQVFKTNSSSECM